jgi:tetratricopeptide (TPR) repeat protein
MQFLILFALLILIGVLCFSIYRLRIDIKAQNSSYFVLSIKVSVITALIVFILIISWSSIYNYLFKKGIDLYFQGRCENSIEVLNKADSIRSLSGDFTVYFDKKINGIPLFFSTETRLLFGLANSYKCNKDFEEAIKVYKIILSKNRSDFNAVASLAYILFVKRNFNESKKYYRKLIELNHKENNFNYYFNMGLAHMVLLEYEIAVRFFNKSLSFNDNQENVLRYIEKCNHEIKQG